jgi:hypothetical protein
MDTEIRIVFTAGTHWISRIIRWVLRSEVSHVFIEYPSSIWGGRWVAEATKGGVRKVQAYKSRHHVYAEFICKFDVRSGLANAAKYVGDEYDYSGAIILGLLALLWRWFKVKLRKPLRASKSQFCSEFVARVLMGMKEVQVEGWDPEQAGPDRLLQFCRKHPELFHSVKVER